LRRYTAENLRFQADNFHRTGRALRRGLPDIARHVIQRVLNPRFLSYIATYDVASITC